MPRSLSDRIRVATEMGLRDPSTIPRSVAARGAVEAGYTDLYRVHYLNAAGLYLQSELAQLARDYDGLLVGKRYFAKKEGRAVRIEGVAVASQDFAFLPPEKGGKGGAAMAYVSLWQGIVSRPTRITVKP